MLSQLDPQMIAMNFGLMIGGVLLLIVGSFTLYATWTLVNVGAWMIQRRRADREFLRESRRADGEPYPSSIEGQCGQCGRGDRRIYFTPSGRELCPTCYEAAWREEEGHTDRTPVTE